MRTHGGWHMLFPKLHIPKLQKFGVPVQHGSPGEPQHIPVTPSHGLPEQKPHCCDGQPGSGPQLRKPQLGVQFMSSGIDMSMSIAMSAGGFWQVPTGGPRFGHTLIMNAPLHWSPLAHEPSGQQSSPRFWPHGWQWLVPSHARNAPKHWLNWQQICPRTWPHVWHVPLSQASDDDAGQLAPEQHGSFKSPHGVQWLPGPPPGAPVTHVRLGSHDGDDEVLLQHTWLLPPHGAQWFDPSQNRSEPLHTWPGQH